MASILLDTQEHNVVKIDAEKIAIVRLGSIGDVINALPLLNRLRAGYPKSHITWIVEEKSSAILEGHAALDRVMVFPRRRPSRWARFVAELRAAEFDLVIDCQRMMRSGLLTRLSGASYRLGFDRARCREASWIFTNLRIPSNSRSGVTLERYLEFADYLELPKTAISWNIPIVQQDRERVSQIISDTEDPPMVFAVGASKREKLWPSQYFSVLAKHMKEHWRGQMVLTGGIQDRERANQVAQEVKVVDTTGALTLKELAVLLERAALVVSCDSGPLHLAVGMGRPVIGLYGPSDPSRTGPYGQADWIIDGRAAPPCRSCKRWCGTPYTPCMNGITPEEVFHAINKRLASHPSWIP